MSIGLVRSTVGRRPIAMTINVLPGPLRGPPEGGHYTGGAVLPNHSQQSRMSKLAVDRPFDETDFHSNLRPNPMCTNARQPLPAREWRRSDFQLIEALPQVA